MPTVNPLQVKGRGGVIRPNSSLGEQCHHPSREPIPSTAANPHPDKDEATEYDPNEGEDGDTDHDPADTFRVILCGSQRVFRAIVETVKDRLQK